MNLRTYLRWILDRLVVRGPRFAKYRPAVRLGTRRVEDRLLRRFKPAIVETSR